MGGITFKVIKKNQILIIAVSLMLVVAGYLNYQYDPNSVYDVELTGIIEDPGDAIYVSAPNLETNIETLEVSANSVEDYFIQSKIERTNAYAEQIEIYEKMIENSSVAEEQKNIAQEQIRKINNERDAIIISENLIKLKGYENALVMVNDNSINIVIQEKELTSKQIAQIQNIVMHEFDTEVEKIHITVK